MNYGQGKPIHIENKGLRQHDAVDRLVAERAGDVNRSHQKVPIKSIVLGLIICRHEKPQQEEGTVQTAAKGQKSIPRRPLRRPKKKGPTHQ